MGKRRPAKVDPPRLPETLLGAFPDHTVDLHGLTAAQAERRVDNLLSTWTRREPGAVLKIVTGVGNRSEDGPVLLHAVEDYLREELALGAEGRISDMARAAGGGGWMVRIRR
jgi:DNA-nicking Smr family endonuclease